MDFKRPSSPQPSGHDGALGTGNSWAVITVTKAQPRLTNQGWCDVVQ